MSLSFRTKKRRSTFSGNSDTELTRRKVTTRCREQLPGDRIKTGDTAVFASLLQESRFFFYNLQDVDKVHPSSTFPCSLKRCWRAVPSPPCCSVSHLEMGSHSRDQVSTDHCKKFDTSNLCNNSIYNVRSGQYAKPTKSYPLTVLQKFCSLFLLCLPPLNSGLILLLTSQCSVQP